MNDQPVRIGSFSRLLGSIAAAHVATTAANGKPGESKQLSRNPFRIKIWISLTSNARELLRYLGAKPMLVCSHPDARLCSG
jgi:hypothetical protein